MSRKKPRLSKPPSTQALADMTPGQQQAALARREAELIAEAAKLEKPPEGERQKVRILKHLKRARNPAQTRGDMLDVVATLDKLIARVETAE